MFTPQSDPLSSALEFVLMDALAEESQSFRRIEAWLDGSIHAWRFLNDISLEAVLTRLERAGCVTTSSSKSDTVYSITAEGRRRLDSARAMRRSASEALAKSDWPRFGRFGDESRN